MTQKGSPLLRVSVTSFYGLHVSYSNSAIGGYTFVTKEKSVDLSFFKI